MSVNPKITGTNGLGDALAEMITHHARALPGYPKQMVKGSQEVAVYTVADEVNLLNDGFKEKE